MISESPLLSNTTTFWQLINMNEDILTESCVCPAVALSNDTEIAILGGNRRIKVQHSYVIVLNTTTKAC